MSPSYVPPPQRDLAGGDQTNTAELVSTDDQDIKTHTAIAAWDSYAAPPFMSSSVKPPGTNGAQPSLHTDSASKPLPKIGETRCYWALLSSGLDFIYLDPVLQSHLEDQASVLVGKSLLEFVHPDERATAEQDLGGVLDSKLLHGSVTRVRYSRLSRIRYALGHRTATSPWDEADKIALDSNYMAIDIVINWAADGLVLCFMHAVTDLTPKDNDEQHKTPWTNWCGTPYMAGQQIELLYQRLLVCIPQTNNPSRVFQILSNQDEKILLMTWPPDQGQGRDYAKLVESVNIRSSEPSGDDAKTSCTRRFKALQDMPMGKVESIIIPHGTIIFACHKVTAPSRLSPVTSMQLGYNTTSQQQNQQYYDQPGNEYPAPPPYPTSASPYHSSHHPQAHPPYPAQHWPEGAGPVPAALPPPNMRSPPYPAQQQWPNQQQYMDSSQAFRPSTPEYGHTAGSGNEGGSPSATSDVVPPPRRRVSPAIPGTTRETHGGRGSGNRPIGILKCASCKATQSPEWRKGPSGKKELCNACGLRYARSRAKKEGTALSSHRRRKDKSLVVNLKRGSAPPSPANGSYSGSRRSGRHTSISAGSASGSEIYSQSGPSGMDGVSPSPSPPASNAGFVHYAHPNGAHQRNSQVHQSDTRSPYSTNTGSFYSVPSPLSNPNTPHSPHSSQMSAMRMESSYPRMPQSPLTSTIAPASYERERGNDRELPPTPVSPESRLSSARSMLMLQQ